MNKEEQKKLLIEMMEADEKDGLYEINNMAQQTAVEWLKDKLKETYDKEGKLPLAYTLHLVEQAKQMEKEKKKHWHSENPNKDGEYICRMDNGYIKMCHYVNGIWYDMWDTGIKGTVKEWMNIPYDNF